MHAAHGILDRVIRDTEVLWALHDRLPEGEEVVRRSILIALGMLGAEVDTGRAACDLSSVDDVRCLVLCSFLADPRRAGERIASLDAALPNETSAITDTALARVDTGLIISAVE